MFRVRNLQTGEVRGLKVILEWAERAAVAPEQPISHEIRTGKKFIIIAEHPRFGWVPLPVGGRWQEGTRRQYATLHGALKEVRRLLDEQEHEVNRTYADVAVLCLESGKVYSKAHFLAIECAALPLIADAFDAAAGY